MIIVIIITIIIIIKKTQFKGETNFRIIYQNSFLVIARLFLINQ